MLLKIEKNRFINTEKIDVISDFYNYEINDTHLKIYCDYGRDEYFYLKKEDLNLEVLEYHLICNNYIRIGKELINSKRIVEITITDNLGLKMRFDNGKKYGWDLSDISENDIKNIFNKFNIESVVKND